MAILVYAPIVLLALIALNEGGKFLFHGLSQTDALALAVFLIYHVYLSSFRLTTDSYARWRRRIATSSSSLVALILYQDTIATLLGCLSGYIDWLIWIIWKDDDNHYFWSFHTSSMTLLFIGANVLMAPRKFEKWMHFAYLFLMSSCLTLEVLAMHCAYWKFFASNQYAALFLFYWIINISKIGLFGIVYNVFWYYPIRLQIEEQVHQETQPIAS